MARSSKNGRRLVCAIAILVIAPLLIWGAVTGREKQPEVRLDGGALIGQVGGIDEPRDVGEVNEVAEPDSAVEVEAGGKAETSSPPRWRQLSFLVPDIVHRQESSTPQENGLKEAPQATAAEAQMTLQGYLAKLSWQDKAMVLKTLTKFSPSEMLEVFRLYKQGTIAAYRRLDAILLTKISQADFEKLRALANKYR